MKKNLLTGFGLSVVLATGLALASGPSGVFYVAEVEVDNTSGGTETFLRWQGSAPSGIPACGASSGWFLSGGTADNVKAMTALATSAFLAGHPVSVWFDGTCITGNGTTSCTTPSSGCYAKFLNLSLK